MNSSASPDPGASAPHHAAIAHALNTLASDDASIGVAVSGGSDSLALLLHASTWASANRRTIHAATVDHGLRPEAASEAAHVARICAALAIPHQTLTWRPPSATVTQAAARTARYTLLANWAARCALPAIAIGHTRDDRLETFLIRARAGSTWYGLAGPMPAAPPPVATAHQFRLLRPLLTTPRSALRADLADASIGWIDDPTNTSRQHERVRMRALLQLAPPATHAAIISAMNRFAAMRAAILATARDALQANVAITPTGATIQPDTLAALPEQSRLRLIEALILSLAPRNAPPRTDRLARLVAGLCDPLTPDSRTTLARCSFQKNRTGVHITPAPPRRNATPNPPPPTDPAARARLLLLEPHTNLLLCP